MVVVVVVVVDVVVVVVVATFVATEAMKAATNVASWTLLDGYWSCWSCSRLGTEMVCLACREL